MADRRWGIEAGGTLARALDDAAREIVRNQGLSGAAARLLTRRPQPLGSVPLLATRDELGPGSVTTAVAVRQLGQDRSTLRATRAVLRSMATTITTRPRGRAVALTDPRDVVARVVRPRAGRELEPTDVADLLRSGAFGSMEDLTRWRLTDAVAGPLVASLLERDAGACSIVAAALTAILGPLRRELKGGRKNV